jgi:hypothetical protein
VTRGREPDAILRSTRWGAAVVLVLAIANGTFLYLLPARAEPDYAWPIAPPVSAAFMGAGYLAGFVAAALALRARYWRSVHSLVWPLATLSAGMLAATLIHADRFRWEHPPAWGWTVVYAAIPPGAAFLWQRQARATAARPPPDARLGLIRALSWPLGALFALLGAVLLVAPQTLVDDWPWQLTPLLGRAFGSWYLLIGMLLLFAAATGARPHELVIPYAVVGTWSVLVLLVPLLHGSDVQDRGANLVLGLGVHAVALVLSTAGLVQVLRMVRREGERL